MRVAQRTISRNYLRTLNNTLSQRAESIERSASGLKFSKLSDNVSDGVRAMQIQEQRYQATKHLDTVEALQTEMNAVDSNLESIQSILQTAQEKVLRGMSDTTGQDGREVLAQELSALKEEILQFANAQYGGKYLFSGTNNSASPFTVGAGGKLCYNGIPVESVYEEDGAYYYDDPTEGKMEIPKDDVVYADIGLGYQYDGQMQADPRTAFQVSFSGLDILGFGTAAGEGGETLPGDVYDLITELENALTTGQDAGKLDALHGQLVELTDRVGMARTDLGTRMSFLDRNAERLENDIDNMTERESNLVSAQPTDEAIKLKESEYVWMAVLQLGSKILPSSLLDFMQ